MDFSTVSEAVGTPVLAVLMILFGGVVFWAFRSRRGRRFGADDEKEG